ncbi:MAG: sugar ABC transporter substrate-binding protein [Bacillota bacterium]
MRRKKVFLLAMTLVIVVSMLVTSGLTNAKGKTLHVAQVAWGLDDIFFQTVQDGTKYELDRLSKKYGFTYTRDLLGDQKPETQVKYLETLMAKKPDILVFCPVDSNLIGPVQQYNAENIPVITNNVTIYGGKHTFVAFDNVIAGETTAKAMIRRLEKKYGKDPKTWAAAGGVIVELTGDWAMSIARDRSRGFHNIMDPIAKDTPGLQVVTEEGKWNSDIAYKKMADLITKYGDKIIATYTHDGTMSIGGVWPALVAAGKGYTIDNPKHIIMCCIDGTSPELQMVREKKLDSVTIQPAWGEGEVVARLIHDIWTKGEKGIAKVGTTLYANEKRPLIMDLARNQFTKEEYNKGAKPVWAPVQVVAGKVPNGSWEGVWYKTNSTMTCPDDYPADSKILWGNFWPYLKTGKWPWQNGK